MQIDKYIDPILLQDNAAFTVHEEVRHDFSEEEIVSMKEQYFTLSNYQDVREEASKTFKALMMELDPSAIIETLDELKTLDFGLEGLKTLKKSNKAMLKVINRGYEIKKAKLFAFPYFEISRMAFYDEAGKYIYDRSLKPEEMQTNLLTNIRKIS